jgi:peptide/nickel transport system substrate-binding protein
MASKKLSRREFLHLSAAAAGTVALAACSRAEPTAAPTEPAPTVPPPEPTATAAVAATKAPEATVAPTATAESRMGAQLIGKLEGPEVITDPAQFPTSFNEAPELAALVKAGELPPVEERIGEDPLVLKPLHETGKYGGVWRRGFTGPADKWNGGRAAAHDSVLWWDYRFEQVVPNIAKGWEFSDDGKTLLLYLRKGMKWSDGYPFTADDFVFCYEDMFLNEEMTPLLISDWYLGEEVITMEKVDDYTIKYNCPATYYFLADLLASWKPIGGGAAIRGKEGGGGFAPAHYLKQFHPKYTSKEEIDGIVAQEGFDNWVSLFKFKNDWSLNPDLPAVTCWITTSPINTPTWILERNPYSFWVDTEGNQLPYIDKIVLTLAEDMEVLNLRAIAGEYDYQSRHIDVGKLPIFLENQEQGGYNVHLDPGDYGADCALMCNLGYEADPEIAKWLRTTDFRRALSLGVNRDDLNEIFWLGLGTPGSVVPADDNRYNPGPEYRELWSTHDPDTANEMLDKLGLDRKDDEGYRLRTDEETRLRIEVTTVADAFMQHTKICEVIKDQWKKIGIYLDVVEVERSLAQTRNLGNECQLVAWDNGSTDEMFMSGYVVPIDAMGDSWLGPELGRWYMTFGQEGVEPPPRMQEAMELFREAPGATEEERTRLGKEIWKTVVDEVWQIGTVGLAPGSMGVRIVNKNMGNVPERQKNALSARTPGSSRPEQFYWKS